MDTASALRTRIARLRKERPWTRQDREQIAALWIRLLDLAAEGEPEAVLSDEEAADAAKYCKSASFSAIYGTASLEYVSLFAGYARRFHRQGNDPFLEIDCLRAEAIAGAQLGRDTIRPFLRSLHLLHRIDAPDADTARKIRDKTASVFRWLATLYRDRKRTARALNLVILAEKTLLSPSPRNSTRGRPPSSKPGLQLKKTYIMHARLLMEIGEQEQALGIIETHIERDETNHALCLEIAGAFLSLNRPDRARPFLERASAHYLTDEHRHYGETLRLLSLQMDEALRTGRTAGLEDIYEKAVAALRLKRSNFIFPENIEAFLEDRTDIYQKMMEWHISRGDYRRTEMVILDSYWESPDRSGISPDRDTAIKNMALSRQSWDRHRLRCLTHEESALPAEHDRFDRIYFHVVPGGVHRLSRISGQERWRKIEWDHTLLLRETGGLMALTTDPRSLPGLFAGSVAYLRDKLFAGLENALDTERTICITPGGPLAGLPWPLFSDRARLVVLPGTAVRKPGRREFRPGFFSLTEDGTTLPLALAEHDCLRKLLPDDIHLVPGKENDSGIKKREALEQLEKNGRFHFAGHGYNHPRFPEQSGILLRGSPMDREKDNVLTFQEIRRLDLSGLRFAFLNSCSSGRGKNYIGGIQISTAAAFLEAGTDRLIVSCNPVMDSSSGDFTRALYSRWNSMPDAPPEEVFFRTHREHPELAAPYLILYGSPPDDL